MIIQAAQAFAYMITAAVVTYPIAVAILRQGPKPNADQKEANR